MTYDKEKDFEDALIGALTSRYGWEAEILKNPTEADLLKNWAAILFANNRDIDRLNDQPLTNGEMQQILEQITALRTPLKLNGFINGKTVAITRDNPKDALHFGKEISLKIYDRREIAAGQSRYQIARQPEFPTASPLLSDRRGDLMLLINGMPVIHLELKRSGVSVSQACNQIEKYSHEGIFSGLFSLVQIFVAMEPEETLYFANPGTDGRFNKDFYFHWADFNNEPINHWQEIAACLLSIPMAHQLIGFYTVADNTDGVLKVMRSYQYYAANAISDKVAKTAWDGRNKLGGYVWHTTGSGKTMTSFKSAQLIAGSMDADKVIFLMDRIELGTQSLLEYRGFADDNEEVQATENTGVLAGKLKSSDPANTLIVTSIQKMSNIKNEPEGFNARDLEQMNSKRIVFIVDEAHRSTFGDMLITIKESFPSAIFFGFTGTPIHDENEKKMNTTATVFGDELHRYSIADGIRDKNVLGFDPYRVATYKDRELRQQVALMRAKAKSEAEALSNSRKSAVYYKYMDGSRIAMAGHIASNGRYIKGIEDDVPVAQYERDEHRQMVVKDIADNWLRLSHNGKFHAIFATSSIVEAIEYYRMFKTAMPELKITALFDPTIDNMGNAAYKEDALAEIIADYNQRYGQSFTVPTHDKFKKDVGNRLAHKKAYIAVGKSPEKQLDLLIVVDQMLTGFDSKWLNTLYLDKLLEYENIIQAFSRTNRLFGPDKPFGTIRYYRKVHTMERNIAAAVELYSGNRPTGLFAQRLEYNLNKLNSIFDDIANLFTQAGIPDFEKLPDDFAVRGRFASLFKELNDYLEAAKIQGFKWNNLIYHFTDENNVRSTITLKFDENTYLTLALRYKELFDGSGGSGGTGNVPFEIDGYLTEIDTGVINADYMNSRFEKYLAMLHQPNVSEAQKLQILSELHKSFATLSQEEQKYANLFLHDVESGSAQMQPGKTFRDYITEYQAKTKLGQLQRLAAVLGFAPAQLEKIMQSKVTNANLDEFGRFTALKNGIDNAKAKAYFEWREGKPLPPFKVNMKIDAILREFIFSGGMDIPMPE